MTIQDCLDTPPRTVVAAAPPHVSFPPARPVHQARADCTSDSAGGLTFAVRLLGASGKELGAREVPGGAAVLLRLRQHDGPEASLRLPLTCGAGNNGLRATLKATALLREGRWDAYLSLDGEEPLRMLPGVHDLRSLAGGAPFHAHAWLGVRLPYTTKHGNLTVRTWLRLPHAEAGALRVEEDAVALHGRLYGVRLTDTACLEARPRDAAVSPVRVPVRPDGAAATGTGPAPGTGPGHDAEGRHPAEDFAAELSLGSLLPGNQVWDLWLRPSDDGEPVRLARILDDVVNKKRVFSYPAQRVAGPGGAVHSVKPYYTINNNLSVRVGADQNPSH